MRKLIVIIKALCICGVASLAFLLLIIPTSCFVDFSENTLKWVAYTPLAVFCSCGLAILVIIFAVAPIVEKKDKTYQRNKFEFSEKPRFVKETVACRRPSEISSCFDSQSICTDDDSFLCRCGYIKRHRIYCCVIELKSSSAVLNEAIASIKGWSSNISENEEKNRLVYYVFASNEDKKLDQFIDDKTFETLNMSSVVFAIVEGNTLVSLKYDGIYPLKSFKTKRIAKSILLMRQSDGSPVTSNK